jgi:hypothetical protein
LYSSCIKILVDSAVPSEHGKAIKYDIKSGSVERSIDRYQRGCTSARCRQQQQAVLAISATNKNRAIFPVGIKIRRPFFKFDSIKEILKAQFIIQFFL